MKRFVLLIISSCVMLLAYAQEEISLDSIPKIRIDANVNQLSHEKPLLFDDSFPMERISLFDQSMFHQPLLPDYNKNLDFIKHLNASGLSTGSFSTGFGISPFYSSTNIYNQAIYKVTDHFSIGGNSFGAQSVFDHPKMNPAIQEMSLKGASMLLQYKFSNNLKVQTRVSISNHRSPWEP